MTTLFDKIKEVTELGATSGFEAPVRNYLRKTITPLVDEVQTDGLGGIFGIKHSQAENAPKVLVAAHMDEVGFMIKEIKPDGTFRVVELGGWNPLVVSSQRFTLHTRDGRVYPVISGSVPPHFLRASGGAASLPSVSDIVFDAGFANQEEANAYGVFPGDVIIPESETMKKAKALLAQKGIGYPAVDSESRIALEGLTTAAEIPSDEDLAKAIDNFYKETKVELPAAGKWYYISNLSPAGKSLYLMIGANGTVGVTENKADATAFEVAEPMLFKTIEGKYLFPATELQDDAADKELKLEKLAITDLDITKQMGLLNLYGYFNTTKTGKVLNAYLAVNHEKKVLVTDDHDSAPTFTETYSTAIQFVETVKPLKMIDMKCTAKPTIISDGMDELTLTFDEKEGLQMAEGTVVKLCKGDGTEIETLNVTVDAEKANVIHVNVASVDNGKYLIAFPEGALSYKESGIVYKNNKVNVEIEVAKSIPFKYTYTGFSYSPLSIFIKDVDLNNFTIGNSHYNYTDQPQGLVVDESKEVELRQVDSDKLIRKGHFKRVASMPGIPDCPEAYQIEFDTPILEGELKPNNYTFVFKAATYGDYNFGKYLQGAASPQECYVNAESTVTLTVDNDKATGISNVTVDGTKNAIIYDIYGRKVTKINQPGIYIVNGKKVIKK